MRECVELLAVLGREAGREPLEHAGTEPLKWSAFLIAVDVGCVEGLGVIDLVRLEPGVEQELPRLRGSQAGGASEDTPGTGTDRHSQQWGLTIPLVCGTGATSPSNVRALTYDGSHAGRDSAERGCVPGPSQRPECW